jgi:peptidoglycan hydrolase-like protein with peptidoglycan-binding domain
VPVYGNTPTIPAQATQAGSPSQSTQGARFAALTKALAKGSKGASVMVLQQMLNQDSDTQVALTGAGSPGNETTLFGNATLAAIKKFQVKWEIAKPGDQGYGTLGPKTRAKLNVLYGK